MPVRNLIQVSTVDGNSWVTQQNWSEWSRSPRVGGKLRLVANPHKKGYYTNSMTGRQFPNSCRHTASPSGVSPGNFAPLWQPAGTKAMTGWNIAPLWSKLEASSYARFRGKLYKGSAALGVTIGSYKQSREMIVNRFEQLKRPWDHLGDILERDRRRGRLVDYADRLSGAHLEVIFGMVPLYQDIIAASTTVIQQAAQRETVRGKTSLHGEHSLSKLTGAYGLIRENWKIMYSMSVTRAAQVRIENPNTWLAERAGLLNLAAVGWDLVPWSFVINMFVNTGQLVNSITDFAGLTFENETTTHSITSSCDLTCLSNLNAACYNILPRGYVEVFKGKFRAKEKRRTLGAVARPPLVFKIPEANFELAAIAASLVTQKISRVKGLLKLGKPAF